MTDADRDSEHGQLRRACPICEAERKLTELTEAVRWERECCQDIRQFAAWAELYARHGEDYVDSVAAELRDIQDAACAEVDRLLEVKVVE